MSPGTPPPRRRLAVLVAVLAALGASLLVASQPASAASTSVPSAAERHDGFAVLAAVNAERAAHHIAPLKGNVRLRTSSMGHDLVMAHFDLMTHQAPGEASLGTRIERTGYNWSWAGENVAWNSDMSEAGVLYLEKLMYNETPPEDGHRLNILNTHYRNLGISVYFDTAHHKVWLTEDFGRVA